LRHLPRRHRFKAWDGTQKLPLDADNIMAAIADDLLEHGDLRWAMRNLVSHGMQLPEGDYLRGLRDLLKDLRKRKQEQLRRYDISSIFEGVRERLEEILALERQRIEEWLHTDPSTEGNFSRDVLKSVAERSRLALDDLPANTAARIKALEDYEFLNTDAQKKYLELVNELRRAMTRMFFKDIENMAKNLSDGDIGRGGSGRNAVICRAKRVCMADDRKRG